MVRMRVKKPRNARSKVGVAGCQSEKGAMRSWTSVGSAAYCALRSGGWQGCQRPGICLAMDIPLERGLARSIADIHARLDIVIFR